jgi:DNA-binding GntR family transcriptional regulator
LRAIEAGNLIDAENLMREHVVRVYNDLNLHLSERSVEPPLG